MQPNDICIMRAVEGSLTDPAVVTTLPHKTLTTFDNPNWKRLIEFEVPFCGLPNIQRAMVKHYHGPEPWYMDGESKHNPHTVICAFGADDGESGKIFVFERDNHAAFEEVVAYASTKGIPKEQMDFME